MKRWPFGKVVPMSDAKVDHARIERAVREILAAVGEDQSRTTFGPLVAPRVSNRQAAFAAMDTRS